MRLYFTSGIIVAILSFIAQCSADETSTSNNIPALIQHKVPRCIETCLENFIASQYPEKCTTLDCMCRTKTPSTLTLGEGAASCFYALCTADLQSTNEVYQVCDSVSGALVNTHATLTATTFAAPTPTLTTQVPDVTTTKLPNQPTHTSEASETTTVPETSISPDITYYHPSSTATTSPTTQATGASTPSSTPTSNSTIPADSKGDSSPVSSATVIGVSVASGIAGTFIVGVAVFFLCRRWRERRQTGDFGDFEIGGVMSEPSDFSNNSRGLSPGHRPRSPPPDATRGQQEMFQNPHSPRVAAWVAQSPPTIKIVSEPFPADLSRSQNIGRAIGSDSDWETSPRTAESQNTLSELVPKSAGLYPKPLQWFRPESWQTLFEEDDQQTKAGAKGVQPHYQSSQQSTPNPQNRSIASGLPSNPRAMKNGFPADKFRRSRNQKQFNESPTPQGTPHNSHAKKLGSPFAGTALRASPSLVSIGPKSSPGTPRGSPNLSNTPASTNTQGGIFNGALPRKGLPTNPKPSRVPTDSIEEVVSRPRIVRGDDIKRVEPGKRSRPPSEVVVPYCPDDLWLERSRRIASRRYSTELPYPSEITPGEVLYPSSPKKQAKDSSKRISPAGRNLTPSRRGDDLYLSVD